MTKYELFKKKQEQRFNVWFLIKANYEFSIHMITYTISMMAHFYGFQNKKINICNLIMINLLCGIINIFFLF